MFSGIQEILVLVIILLGILFLPRIMNRGQEKKATEPKPTVVLSGKMRLAVGASIIWPAIMAAYLQPWRSDLILFLYSGPGPVVLAWIIFWVLAGFRSK
jgi:membrane associated rhomboid family serine protease